jgi:hypothetical protein
MKLFNTKINLNFIKNSAKFLILAFLIIYCIYILYFSSLKTVESFANTSDCSKCEVKPTSGNCIKIYDFSYSIIDEYDAQTELTISFEKIDTSYIFCPWEPNCDISSSYKANMLNRDSRQLKSNSELEANMFGSLNNIRCCSNNDPFYAAETKNYYSVFDNLNTINNISNMCNQFDIDLSNYGVYPKRNYDSLTSLEKTNLGYVLDQTNYAKVKNFCLNHDKTHENYFAARSNIDDFSGILFKVDISDTGHVLQDPRLRKPGLTRKTIIDNIISKQQLIDISNDAIKKKYSNGDFIFYNGNKIMKTDFNYIVNDVIIDVSNSFYQVIDKHNKRLNALKTLNMSNADFEQTLNIILTDLVAHYNQAPSNYNNKDGYYDNSYQIFNYTPSKITNTGQGFISETIDAPPGYSKTYILNENEFLNCFGHIESVPDLSFNFTASGDFFGSSDPTLTTFEQSSSNNYGPSAELEMELRRLQNVPPGGNAPVGVINQYLNAINGFYERHISNMLGPKTHSANNQLVFENDNLEIKTPTFFKYETDPNNKYECQPSITGNDKFKDCGPTAYYTDFKS